MTVCVLFVGLVLSALQGGRSSCRCCWWPAWWRSRWNGLAFLAVGELAGPGRAGTALGVQNTAVALGAALTPPVLGALVDRTAWPAAYALRRRAGRGRGGAAARAGAREA